MIDFKSTPTRIPDDFFPVVINEENIHERIENDPFLLDDSELLLGLQEQDRDDISLS